MTTKITSAEEFFLWDYDSTLFPLSLNRLLVERYATELRAFIKKHIIDGGGSFQLQHRVFASKRGWFLRRTVKLDPVAEFFLYDLVYRNRARFEHGADKHRTVHGFVIEGGEPASTIKAHAAFKADVANHRASFANYAYFDVASYFNHVYHHDLVRWFEDVQADAADVQAFGRFLREIAGGRSIDCLPQGLYPAKMVGSAFLSFIDESNRLRSRQSVRFMDDMWLFDSDRSKVVADFVAVQALLSGRGLSINDKKSAVAGDPEDRAGDVPHDIDDIKVTLLRRRREQLAAEIYGDDAFDEDEEDDHPDEFDELTAEEREYLLSLVRVGTVTEEDAELVLTLMRDYTDDLMEFLPSLISDFPALAKRVYHFCADVPNKNDIAAMLVDHLRGDTEITEFQLFWIGKMAEDYFLSWRRAGDLLRILYEHPRATSITRAKILEIPSKKFGLPDLREEQLKTGHSDWLAWSAAVGSRVHPKGQRNQILKYFRRASLMNQLIGEFVESRF